MVNLNETPSKFMTSILKNYIKNLLTPIICKTITWLETIKTCVFGVLKTPENFFNVLYTHYLLLFGVHHRELVYLAHSILKKTNRQYQWHLTIMSTWSMTLNQMLVENVWFRQNCLVVELSMTPHFFEEQSALVSTVP